LIIFYSLLLIVNGLVALFYSSFSNIKNASPSPSLLMLIIGYGFYFLIFIFAIFFQKNKDKKIIFLYLWFFLSLILVYSPLPFARLFIRGLFFPLVLISLNFIRVFFPDERGSFLNFLLVFISLFSTVFITSMRINEAGKTNPWIYQKKEVISAFSFIKNSSFDGVLAGYYLANLIPFFTGKKVYLGHPNQTPDFNARYLKMSKFYQGKLSNQEAKKFLEENKISLISYSDEEKSFGKINRYSFLKKIFSNAVIEIFSF